MISVIIPVFNAVSKGLNQCLQNVANQSFSDLEVILVDDGSTDESVAICKKWVSNDDRFELICQEHLGPAAARNIGLKAAKGCEIAFVDSDDTPDLQMLQILHEALSDFSADLVVSNYYERGEVQRLNMAGTLTGKQLLKGILDYHSPICKALYAKLFRKDVLNGIWFNDLRTCEDVDFLSRVYLNANDVAYIDRPLYHYNLHQTSILHTQTVKDYMDILTCYESLVERVCGEAKELKGRALDALMRKVVSTRYRNRKFADADLTQRLDRLQARHVKNYLYSNNGNFAVKLGILASLWMPWFHALIMDCRER